MDPTEDVMDHETQIDVSKKMYFGGYFFLPWLWMVNYLLFRPYMKRQDCPEEVKQYAKRSFVLFFVFTALIVGWYITFFFLRSPSWDTVTLVVPKG